MNTLKISKASLLKRHITSDRLLYYSRVNYHWSLLMVVLFSLLAAGQYLIIGFDPTNGFIDPNIWLLLLLSLIAFLVVTGLCWWLLHLFWMSLGLPVLGNMVSQFKVLSPWQQLGFYWASFGLLLLAAVGVMMAVL